MGLASPLLILGRAVALAGGWMVGLARLCCEGLRHLSAKRAMDIAGALLGLLFTAPLMVLIACLIKLDSPGPVLFTQLRAGKDGRPFRIYKFRSMAASAEEMLDQLVNIEELNPPVFKLKDDPRVTRLGRILRRLSLDELPQLLNVLKGDMSLVGPRPEEMRLVRRYEEWHRQRLAVKPGMTGPMQISGRGDLPLDERVRLEIDYIEHHSLWRDVVVLLKTIPAVIRGRGSY